MRKKLIAAALIFGLTSIQAPVAFAAFPVVSLPVPQTVKFDQGTTTLVPPTSNSPGVWTATVTDPTIATVKGLVVTVLKAGTTGITYTQAASGSFTSVSRVSRLIVEKGTPKFGTWNPVTATLLSRTLKLTPPTSNSVSAWSYKTSDSKIATVSGDTLTFLDAGTTTITATQSPTNNWLGGEVSTTLTVTSLPKTLGTFTDITIAKDSVSNLNLIEPTSISSGLWTFTIANSAIATLVGKVLTPKNIGTTTITARQAAFGGYGSSTLTMTLTILGATTSIGEFKDVTYNQSPTTANILTIVAPASNSPAAWVFSSSDASIASITTSQNAGAVRVYKPGRTTITASQAVSGNYSAASKTMTLTVSAAPTYVALEDLQKVVGDAAQTILPPTSTSAGAWIYTSSDPAVVSITGQKLNFGNAGTAVITLTQAANDYWLSGSTTFKVTVLGTTPTVGTLSPVKVEVGQTLTTITNPGSNSTGKWKYSITDPTIAKVVNNAIVGVAVGTTTIIATQSPGGKYGQSNSVQAILTVVAATPKPTPTPTPKASTSATPKPTPIPSATSSAAKPVVKVTVKKRVINVSVKGSIVTVLINGKKVKLGNNTVKAGANTVIVKVGTTVIFNKTYRIK
jgi:hypothetical protein